MVASRKVEILFYRVNGRGFDALAQVFRRTAITFSCKYIVPAGKHVDADLLEFSVPEVAEVVDDRKNFETAAKSVGRQTLRKQLVSGSRKKTPSRVISSKTTKQISRSRGDFSTSISR